MESATKAGMVAIVGLPNAGKSSLLNQMLGTKLSIVTAAAQTTREQVVGIETTDAVQMIFLDTPGIVDPAYLLHHSMLEIVEKTINDADVVVLLLDGTRGAPEIDGEILQSLLKLGSKLLVAINKTDAAQEHQAEELSIWAQNVFGKQPIRISATRGEGVEELRAQIAAKLPDSPFLYPDDDVSTQSVRFFVSELIRETIFEQYQEEVPYSSAVVVDEYREGEDPVFIRATVYLERASQKGIVIGKGGEAIRHLGTDARRKIEEFVGARVYLDLWVKVLPKWRKKPEELRRFGFPVPDLQR